MTLVVNNLCQTINLLGQSDIIFLDYSKAFDNVSHCKLLHRLKIYGICDQALLCIKCYSNGGDGRREVSSLLFLFGVPQGTVLEPILFATFIIDIGQARAKNVLDQSAHSLDVTLQHSITGFSVQL